MLHIRIIPSRFSKKSNDILSSRLILSSVIAQVSGSCQGEQLPQGDRWLFWCPPLGAFRSKDYIHPSSFLLPSLLSYSSSSFPSPLPPSTSLSLFLSARVSQASLTCKSFPFLTFLTPIQVTLLIIKLKMSYFTIGLPAVPTLMFFICYGCMCMHTQ